MALKYYHITGAILILVIFFSVQFMAPPSVSESQRRTRVNRFTKTPELAPVVNFTESNRMFEQAKYRGMYHFEMMVSYEVDAMESQNLGDIIDSRKEESTSPGAEIEGCVMCMVKYSMAPKEFVKKMFGKSYYPNYYLTRSCPEAECENIFHHEKDCCERVVDRICDYWMRKVKGWRVYVPLDSVTQRVYENNHDLIQSYCNSRFHTVCRDKAFEAWIESWHTMDDKNM